jgi:hypothetical protein
MAGGQASTTAPTSIHPLYWVRDEKQILKDGVVFQSDAAGIISARISWDARYLVYTRDHTVLMLVDIKTGKRNKLFTASGATTVQYTTEGAEEGEAEREVVLPLGFSPDNKRIYFLKQQSRQFVDGNELISRFLINGKTAVEYKGLKDAAISQQGDLIICKAGTVLVQSADGSSWAYDVKVRATALLGVGVTTEGKPFYYTADSIHLFEASGNETRINVSSPMESKPLLIGSVAVWASNHQILSTESGEETVIDVEGSNSAPFK